MYAIRSYYAVARGVLLPVVVSVEHPGEAAGLVLVVAAAIVTLLDSYNFV